jgi:anaerobic magnesium-protoporphyrin IX monomethyl ester cyclase
MRIVLVNPKGSGLFRVPPLGLGYLAAVLEREEFDVKIVDLNVESSSALEESLSGEGPDVLGVSCAIGNASQAFSVINIVKTHFPECLVGVGGPYASMMGEAILARHPEIDAVVVGEGEVTFVELVRRLQDRQDLSDVNGLIFREGSKIKTNPLRDPIEPLDCVPFPAREMLPMKRYGENRGVLFTSRGCPYRCAFCSRPVFGRRWRGHSPDYVLAEIERLRKRCGVSSLSFLDDNFTFDLGRAGLILDGIISKRWKLGLYFWNGLRVDSVTEALLTKMKKAGCTAINYGVESVDPEVLAEIKKGITLDQVDEALKLTRKAGIKANVFLMVGNPGDNVKIVENIREFVERAKVDGVHLSLATPIPRTAFWSWVGKKGHWLDHDRRELLDWPVDDVEDAYPVFETPDFTAKQRTDAYRKIMKFLARKKLLM